MEYTLAIVKPDAVEKGVVGGILKMIEDGGLEIMACKTLKLSKLQAEGFYAVHRERPFFGELTDFMSSGRIFVALLRGENAVERYRQLMGPTDSTKAPEGTIRNKYGTDIQANAVHGSDSLENAKKEIGFFFSESELRALGIVLEE